MAIHTDPELDEMIARLQRGEALATAEQRQTIKAPPLPRPELPEDWAETLALDLVRAGDDP